MPRKEPTSQGFGSDSFLDVLCNMVGILVILIVIAGMRVSRAPVILPDDLGHVDPVPPTVLDEPVELGEPATMNWAVEAPPPEIPQISPPPKPFELAPLDPPQELVDATSSTQADIVALTAQLAETEATTESITGRITEQLNAATLDNKTREELAQAEQHDLESLKSRLATLESELREARAAAPTVKILKHTTAPVSRRVRGLEVHFRLSQNKVSVVPFEQLKERMAAQYQRRRNFLATQEYYVGTVDPIDGYLLEFIIERADSTPKEMAYTARDLRAEITRCSVRPVPGLIEENAEQALKNGSIFQRAMKAQGRSATLTFWVYSDSFEIHRQLQDFAQERGYYVASRPRPDGVPITVGKNGTASMAQ